MRLNNFTLFMEMTFLSVASQLASAYVNEERLSVTNLSTEHNLPMFWETTGRRPLGEDNSTGPWQRTGAVGEGGPAYPDDTFRGALQPRWRTESPWLLDHCDGEAGREEQSSPTSDFQ